MHIQQSKLLHFTLHGTMSVKIKSKNVFKHRLYHVSLLNDNVVYNFAKRIKVKCNIGGNIEDKLLL